MAQHSGLLCCSQLSTPRGLGAWPTLPASPRHTHTHGPQVHRSEGLIYMVLEYGDIDLARLLQVGRGWLDL